MRHEARDNITGQGSPERVATLPAAWSGGLKDVLRDEYGLLPWRVLDEALAAVARGWWLIPLDPRSKGRKEPFHSLLPRDPKTGRATWKPLTDTPADAATVREWWGVGAMFGVICGRDLVILDLDDLTTWARVQAAGKHPVPLTAEAVTPRPGRHVCFRASDGETVRTRRSLPGLPGAELIGDGNYVVLPGMPDRHWRQVDGADGETTTLNPDTVGLAPLPHWLTNGSPPTPLRLTAGTSNADGGSLLVPSPTEPDVYTPLRGLSEPLLRRAAADFPLVLANHGADTAQALNSLINRPAVGIHVAGYIAESVAGLDPAEVRWELATRGQTATFRCPLHREESPSASLWLTETGSVVFHDWHAAKHGSRAWIPLAELYARMSFAAVGMSANTPVAAPSLATWQVLLMTRAGVLKPADIPAPVLAHDVAPSIRATYEGFLELLRAKWTYEAGAPTACSYRFLAAVLGGVVSKTAVGCAMPRLIAAGFIVKVGEYTTNKGDKLNIYLPGDPETRWDAIYPTTATTGKE